MIYIIHGPQGCGKTRNAHAIAEFFGCALVVDPAPENATELLATKDTLFVTNMESIPTSWLSNARVMHFDVAMDMINLRDAESQQEHSGD